MIIYVVEDDISILKLIEYALKSKEYEVSPFENGSDFFNSLKDELPDLILLDIMLPDIDGMEILKELKKNSKTKDIPVMMLTAKDAEIDIVTALDNGADDYMTKPFSVLELLSRVNVLLRRLNKNPEESIEYGGIKIDLLGRNVYIDSEKIDLTYKEFELLNYLMDNKNIVLSRENLISSVWGYDYEGETRTIDMHIKSLRSKLKDKSIYIKTIRGVGYKFSVGE
ncbi:response regulator transcription factor [Peptoniphilus stercorisuis]|uniref:Two-component system alkaline phosphatase synthesis response regulator PhoP n=1 Tax=Peptoniphilus stercorisuis TaxID=1436965 RepID=A0ABS4KEK8_9FIRM|nr:response regulator transcription factor [Peptoniphilus stercorisuis]MBP2026199.1 two-component system alkaline phosphatase synthesis response regulator PhoP [Peptoniphilus stercorisuis]